MANDEPLQAAWDDLRARLVAAGRLLPTSVEGLYGRDAMFESVVHGLIREIDRLGSPDGPEHVDFPPLIPTTAFDTIGYLETFPHLCGLVYSFDGDDRAHATLLERFENGGGVDGLMSRADLTLTPACCYPVYPMCSGELPIGGRTFQLSSYCYRHEPSRDPMRLQVFRQFENVRLGTAEEVLGWREPWLGRAEKLLNELGLDVVSDVANDPFFGRRGRLMSMSQREQKLKIEFLVNVFGDEARTACVSVNYHQEHFGELFHISTADGSLAHSSCIGFGLERCVVALFATHGTSVDKWPAPVRDRLLAATRS
ncbi:MAG: amino acid--[acyl-carrier-protein] ligase [Ilumatobacteraceae bacterium]